MHRLFIGIIVVLLVALSVFAQEKPAPKKTLDELTANLQRIAGFIPLFYDSEKDRMFLEITRLNQEFLYQISLPTGVGSNPIGLDRGQLGETRIVYFERAGNKILLIQPNYKFRALSDNPAERLAVEESFAKSVIWGFEIAAVDGDRILVDATKFLVRDAHGVADRLRRTNQGTYSMDESRSAFYLPRTKGFPQNTEVEATITLTAKGDTGRLINQTAPSGDSVTVRQRHSLVQLPDNKYRPRRFDPRVGVMPISFYDYATGINENLETRWIQRHRLERKDPRSTSGEAVKPIIYYVDNGAPKVIQDALIDGAVWWNQAFEAAGYKDAFQVKVLPAGADPQDVRYNVINWVHRSTRGWAYGSSIADPRTGEIIKGDVTLDSQRARQDFLIGSALAPQYAASNAMCDFALMPDADYLTQSKSDAYEMSLARIRQLSAHEVGHTLGFTHNFAASTYGRASVMDYPAPLIGIKDGQLDFSDAYATGIGAYDKFAVQYAYTDFPAGTDEAKELDTIIRRGVSNSLLFIADDDTRPAGAAHPLANLWDNGSDPIANLRHEMRVRRIGLDQFGLSNVDEGMPLSELESKLLPLYLHHRYQLTAAAKSLGGVYYTYAVRSGDTANPSQFYEIVSPERQREALRAILETIKTDELVIPDNILKLIPPTAYGFRSNRSELFPKRTDPIFDPLGAAEIAAGLTLSELLEPNRAARLITFNARDSRSPDFSEVINELIKATWAAPSDGFSGEVQQTVQNVTVSRLMDLASDEFAQPQVRAITSDSLRKLLNDLANRTPDAHYRNIIEEIEKFLSRPAEPRRPTRSLPQPPGDPIG